MSSDTEDFYSACSGSSENNEELTEKNIASLNIHAYKVSVDQESTTSTLRASERLTSTISANEENARNEMKEQELFEVKGHVVPQRKPLDTTQKRGGGFQEYNQQRAAQAAALNAQRFSPQTWNGGSASPSPQVSPRVANPSARRTVSSSSSQQGASRPFNQRGSPMERPPNNSPHLGMGRQNDYRDQRNQYAPSPPFQQNRNGYNSDQYYSDHQGYGDSYYDRRTQRMDSRNYEHDGYQSGSQSEDIGYNSQRRDEDDDLENLDEDEEERYSKFPQVLRQTYSKGRSFSEKMGYIGEQIRFTTKQAILNDGYRDMNRLLNHFYDDSGVDGNELAKSMGYNSFRDMCIYAPEVACLHKWTITEKDGAYTIDNYQPKQVDEDDKKLIEEIKIGQEHKARNEDIRNDALQRFINRVMEQDEKPTFKELDYRYRLCQTLDALKAYSNKPTDMGTIKHKHMEMHGEKFNAKVYREMFNRKSNHKDLETLRTRLFMEMTIRANGKNDGLRYNLNHPLDVIKQYHDRLKVEIQKYNDKVQAKKDAEIARQNDGWPAAQKHVQSKPVEQAPGENTKVVDGEGAFGSVFDFG